MNWPSLAALRKELRTYVDSKVGQVFVWTRTANSTELGKSDAVETGDDDDKKGQRPVRRIEPWGVRGRPVAKQRQLSIKLGSSVVIYLGVASDGGYGPGDLEDGETAIYSKNIEKGVHLRDDGVTAINGDDYHMPKWDNFMSGLSTFLTALKTDMTAANAGSLVGNPAIVAFENAIAAATQYKSSKAKNG